MLQNRLQRKHYNKSYHLQREMLGGNNGKHMLPVFLEGSQIQYQTNASNQLQLFGNLPVGCSVDQVTYFCNEQINPMLHPNKRSRETEDISQQKLQISLNYNLCKDDADHLASIRNPNPVSTGLRLSYDDDEHNSSVTSASGSMAAAAPAIVLSLGDSVMTELDRQNEEFDKYIKIQEEQMAKGVRDMKQRHLSSFLAAVEKGVSKKLQEKDLEIENINRKNRELYEKIKQVALDAHNWHYRAKYNESLVNVLKSNLQQAISHGAEQGKEGFGDSEVDDAASHIDPNNYLITQCGTVKEHMICRACKAKKVSILLIPCRHLCLCSDCDRSVSVCPVCHAMKTSGLQVYLS